MSDAGSAEKLCKMVARSALRLTDVEETTSQDLNAINPVGGGPCESWAHLIILQVVPSSNLQRTQLSTFVLCSVRMASTLSLSWIPFY